MNGRRVLHTLGAYPSVTLADARKRAAECLSNASDGAAPEKLEPINRGT